MIFLLSAQPYLFNPIGTAYHLSKYCWISHSCISKIKSSSKHLHLCSIHVSSYKTKPAEIGPYISKRSGSGCCILTKPYRIIRNSCPSCQYFNRSDWCCLDSGKRIGRTGRYIRRRTEFRRVPNPARSGTDAVQIDYRSGSGFCDYFSYQRQAGLNNGLRSHPRMGTIPHDHGQADYYPAHRLWH